MTDTILLVEDQPTLRFFLDRTLREAGYLVDAVATGREALAVLARAPFSLALVDLRLPDMSGLDVAAQVREQHPDAAVIILTAYADLDSALAALRSGVYDYLIKPVKVKQLLAVVDKALQHHRRQRQQRELLAHIEESSRHLLQILGNNDGAEAVPTKPGPANRLGNLILDEKGVAAWWKGKPLALTSTEFALLAALARRPGEVVRCAELVRIVYNYDLSEPSARDLIKPHIYRLRQKIEPDPTFARHLVNVRGRGYKFVPWDTEKGMPESR